MAKQSVQKRVQSKEIVSHPDFIYTESDPFERAWSRLNGIGALEVVAACALESDSKPTPEVWSDLWYFVGTVTEDVKRDMYEMHQSPLHREA